MRTTNSHAVLPVVDSVSTGRLTSNRPGRNNSDGPHSAEASALAGDFVDRRFTGLRLAGYTSASILPKG